MDTGLQRRTAVVPGASSGLGLADPGATDALVGAAQERFGPVDVLVLNGGGPPPGLAVDFTPEQLADAVALLVQPHQRLGPALLPGMPGRGVGPNRAIR